MSTWFYAVEGHQHGPVDEGTFKRLVDSGQITPTTLVWREGMAGWQEWSGLADKAQIPEPVPDASSPYLPPQTPVGHELRPASGYATASLVCGLASLVLLLFCFLGIFAAIPAVIYGHLSLGQIRQSPVPMAGRGLAITGLISGYITIVASLIPLLMLLAMTLLAF